MRGREMEAFVGVGDAAPATMGVVVRRHQSKLGSMRISTRAMTAAHWTIRRQIVAPQPSVSDSKLA